MIRRGDSQKTRQRSRAGGGRLVRNLALWIAVALVLVVYPQTAKAQDFDPRNPPTLQQVLQRLAIENVPWEATTQFEQAHWGIYGICNGEMKLSYYHDEIGISSELGSRVNRVSQMYRAGSRYVYWFAGRVEVVEFYRNGTRMLSPVTGGVLDDRPRCAVAQEQGRWPANQSRHPLYTGVTGDAVISSPRWLRQPRPEFPDRARARGIRSGRVALTCNISPSGMVSGCEIEMETPAGFGFGSAAVVAAQRSMATRSERPYRLRFSLDFAE